MAEIDPNVRQVLALIPDYEVRDMLAHLVQEFRKTNGMEYFARSLPRLMHYWKEPQHYDWPPT